jgi:ubiquinone/menaquinone biosynthesis C-methylase UbiE
MTSTTSPSQMRGAGVHTRQDKLARLYEEDAYPLIGQKLADLLTTGLVLPNAAQALLVGCGLGQTPTEILHQTNGDSRVVAVEATQALLDRARANVASEHVGRRIFLRTPEPDGKLPFADGEFDVVLANLDLGHTSAPGEKLAELVRVCKPHGEVRVATTLAGTWREFLDVYTDVLVRLRRNEATAAIETYRKGFPDSETLARQLEALGLGKVAVTTTHWELVFRTGREFFYAPVIELGPLARWKAMAGKGPEMQDTFLAVKEAIDTYFGGSAFGVSVYAGLFSASKP